MIENDKTTILKLLYMKTILLLVANLAGIMIFVDLVDYLQTSGILKIVFLLSVTAFVAYCCRSADENRRGWFYVFAAAFIAVMDVLLLSDHSAVMSYTAEIIVLFVLNMFAYWVLEGLLLLPTKDDQRPKE